MSNRKIIFILGPTSSGKTAVAVKLAGIISGEIISCDSMQIYKGMDILTQAPSSAIIQEIPHHMVRVMDPQSEYDAARFSKDAAGIIKRLSAEGKIPVVSGGTGLYVRALVDGIFDTPKKDEELRKRLEKEAEAKGAEYLHSCLRKVDPVTADRLHTNDLKRIIRAIEIYELTGRTASDKAVETAGIGGCYDCRMFGLRLEREALYERINATVDRMFSEGLVEEVKGLLDAGLGLTARQALGIKEISSFLKGDISLDEAVEELKKNTRRYAKRQLTWFRSDKRIEWLDADRSPEDIAREIVDKASDES